MNGYALLRPTSLQEAIQLLDTDDPTVRPFSGGTALMLMMKSGVFEPSKLVCLHDVESTYAAIETRADGGLRIGAMASLTALEHSKILGALAPMMPRGLRRLANVRVRNVARVGGCLAHGDPHMDLPPMLAALRASVTILGPQGKRQVAVEDLFVGYYETVLKRGELVANVDIPAQQGWISDYLKITTRTADDWPALGIGLVLRHENNRLVDLRLFVSAATEKLTRLHAAEDCLRGREIDAGSVARCVKAAADEVETIDDTRGSASFKKHLLQVHLRRALEGADMAEKAA